jgi:hypothetical protein
VLLRPEDTPDGAEKLDSQDEAASDSSGSPGLMGHAIVFLEIVEADANSTDVPLRIGCCAEADEGIHLTDEALRALCGPEPDPAMTGVCFEFIEMEQQFTIHVDLDATISVIILAVRDLHSLDQVIEFCGPFDNGSLTRHVPPAAGNPFPIKRNTAVSSTMRLDASG